MHAFHYRQMLESSLVEGSLREGLFDVSWGISKGNIHRRLSIENSGPGGGSRSARTMLCYPQEVCNALKPDLLTTYARMREEKFERCRKN